MATRVRLTSFPLASRTFARAAREGLPLSRTPYVHWDRVQILNSLKGENILVSRDRAMNATQALDIHLTALVAIHGHQRVQKALARIDDGHVARLDELGVDKDKQEMPDANTKKTRRTKSLEEIIQEAHVDQSVRSLVQEIGHAYEQGTFLPDLWRVRKFLDSEGVEASKLRSRSAALRKVIAVLARQSHQRLQDLLVESKGRGPLATLTDQILGSPTQGIRAAANPGTPGRSTDSTVGHG